MRFADGDVIRVPVGPGALHVERYGFGGGPVVLLHGFGTTAFLWRHVAPALAAAGRTAYVPDLFGYGASDRPFDAGFGIRAQAGYLASALARLGVKDVTLVGNDIGAVIALLLAFERPSYVNRVVLVSPAPVHDLPGADVRMMQRETARHVVRLVAGLFGAQPLVRVLLEHAVTDPAVVSPALLGRYVAPYLGRDGVTHFLTLARALEDDDLSDLDLARVGQAAVVVHGSEDRWCSPEEARRLAGDLPAGATQLVPGAARLVAEEAPEALIRVILAGPSVP
jgi:pimeloyl-ACP methyl ester carboxylesterase